MLQPMHGVLLPQQAIPSGFHVQQQRQPSSQEPMHGLYLPQQSTSQQQAMPRGLAKGACLSQQPTSMHPTVHSQFFKGDGDQQMPLYMHERPDSYGHQYIYYPQVPQATAQAQRRLTPDPSSSHPPTRKFFSKAITNATSELPLSVIKELKGGFKNYIPLALCTHKACSNATRYTDPFDAEIGWTDKGEMKLKQKSMTSAKDHYLTTDDFTEARENFVRGLRKHLVMSDLDEEAGSGKLRALECADMFADFFSVIAARPDYTQDWPAYRGYIIESYTSWVGRRDDSYGLIFDDHLFYKHKMTHFTVLLEQLRQPTIGSSSTSGGRGAPGMRGRGRGLQGGAVLYPSRGGFQTQPFHPQQPPTSFRCYLCGGTHYQKDHQGPATRLVLNEHNKWVDKALGSKIVCILFNISSTGCKRGTACTYSHSCSLCGDLSHGSAKCGS